MARVKDVLRLLPFAAQAKRILRQLVINADGEIALDIVSTFAAFSPNSPGSYPDKALLTIASVNRTMPSLVSLVQSLNVHFAEPVDIESFMTSDEDRASAGALKQLLDGYGSDKANYHNYHCLYGVLLKDRAAIAGALEIGIGTNNTSIVSNMGAAGRPGASLRAFQDFLPKAAVYGADIDPAILFQEDRINTFFVDQTNPASFDLLAAHLPAELDLVIDDGLHSPDANIETLRFGLQRIKVGGWVVVEDIAADAIPVWQVVSAFLPSSFESYLFSAKAGSVFAVKKVK